MDGSVSVGSVGAVHRSTDCLDWLRTGPIVGVVLIATHTRLFFPCLGFIRDRVREGNGSKRGEPLIPCLLSRPADAPYLGEGSKVSGQPLRLSYTMDELSAV